jgi:thymidylate synthase ThyX
MTISAKVLADSVHHLGSRPQRIITVEARMPRAVLPQLSTHRMFSKSTASSRAVPFERMVADVLRDTAVPSFWGANQAGMVATEEMSEEDRRAALTEWLDARDTAIAHARRLAKLGLHKQSVNRLIEPFAHTTVLITATDWANFFQLRMHHAAQPELQALAAAIFEAQAASTPVDRTRLKGIDRWHLPMVDDDERHKLMGAALKVCVARTARVSYANHHGVRDFGSDVALHDRLTQDGHYSPFEHAALPFRQPFWKRWAGHSDRVANLAGWKAYRKTLPSEHPYYAGQVTP